MCYLQLKCFCRIFAVSMLSRSTSVMLIIGNTSVFYSEKTLAFIVKVKGGRCTICSSIFSLLLFHRLLVRKELELGNRAKFSKIIIN